MHARGVTYLRVTSHVGCRGVSCMGVLLLASLHVKTRREDLTFMLCTLWTVCELHVWMVLIIGDSRQHLGLAQWTAVECLRNCRVCAEYMHTRLATYVSFRSLRCPGLYVNRCSMPGLW